jgi:hypothetical protein
MSTSTTHAPTIMVHACAGGGARCGARDGASPDSTSPIPSGASSISPPGTGGGFIARDGAGSAGSLTVAGVRESAAAPRRPVRLSPESMTEGAFEAMGPDRVVTNDIDALAVKSCWHKNNNLTTDALI